VVRAAALLVLASGLSLTAQQPARDVSHPKTTDHGNGSLRGRVIAADSGLPLRNARVTLTSDDGQLPSVLTDGAGRFVVESLMPAAYIVTADKAGYATARFGARKAADAALRVDVTDGAVVDGIDIQMLRAAAITGRVVDDLGDPMPLATVVAQVVRHGDGRTNVTAAGMVQTDDLGEYRLGGLAPGRYVVGLLATSNGEIGGVSDGVFGTLGPTYSRMYYPASPGLAQAQPIAVRAGDEVAGIDLTTVLTKQAKLTIAVLDADGHPADAEISVGNDSPLARFPSLVMVDSRHAASAAIQLEPAEWVVAARGNRGVAMSRVNVFTDESSLTLSLVAGGRVRGRIVTDTGVAVPADATVDAVALDRAVAATDFRLSTTMKPDGTFEISKLLGSRELRLRTQRSGWVLKDVLLAGRSIADSPIEFNGDEDLRDVQVIITNRHPQLTGTVVDGNGSPVPDCAVVLFPSDDLLLRNTRRWARLGRTDKSARFTIDDALAGTYFAVAVDDVDEVEWQNAVYLSQLTSRATRVTLADTGKKSITLVFAGAAP
jgi:carboxypeptidase family protein